MPCSNHPGRRSSSGRRSGLRVSLPLALAWLCLSPEAHAICGLDAAFVEQVRTLEDPAARRAWAGWFARQGGAACNACHVSGGYGPRNPYGSALEMLLSGNDREDTVRKREAGRRVNEIPAIPSLPDSPTFGELIRRGIPPASDFATELPAGEAFPATPAETVTVESARELVARAEVESSFEILQLSQVHELDEETAAAIAEFRGEFLILGLKTLTPDVARALAASRAANVWLHSLTSVAPEAAEAITLLPGHLVMSGLVELDSPSLARKLAQRPDVLSLPSLKRVGPEVAAALGVNERGLSLAAVTELSPQGEAALAASIAPLSLPGLQSLKSLPLTEKLAAGYAASVLLPRLESLSAEQARVIAGASFQVFWGGIFLPPTAMSEEVAAAFAEGPGKLRLTLGAGAISDPALKILVETAFPLELLGMETFDDEQVRILATAADWVPGGPFGARSKLATPDLKSLDSPLLAKTMLRCGGSFAGVTRITPEAAAALGSEPAAKAERPGAGRPNSLSFPSLEALSDETARRLAGRPWSTISLPSLRQASPETVRSLARQTSNLELGIGTMTPEVASAFGEMASDPVNLGGGLLSFPSLTDLSPEAARNLVRALNRGNEIRASKGALDRAPQLFIGGRLPGGSSPPLTAAVAAELAAYRGRLSIAGIRELSPEAAAALAAYRGPTLDLSGPGTDTLQPETAAALARIPVKLTIGLRVLDSVPLAERFARGEGSLDELESIAAEAIPSFVKKDGFFTLRKLPVLDSPELAARLIQDSSGQGLPSLQRITPAAAEVLVTGPGKVVLGLRVLDDPAVAVILTKARKGVMLPRLRAATPPVIAILKDARSIETPFLGELYGRVDSDDFPVDR